MYLGGLYMRNPVLGVSGDQSLANNMTWVRCRAPSAAPLRALCRPGHWTQGRGILWYLQALAPADFFAGCLGVGIIHSGTLPC